jgi:hypothetical protein
MTEDEIIALTLKMLNEALGEDAKKPKRRRPGVGGRPRKYPDSRMRWAAYRIRRRGISLEP